MNCFRLILIAIVLSGYCFESAVAKDTIRGNAGVSYTQIEYDGELIDKAYSSSIYTTVYVSPVAKKQHPWKEAAFLERASSITARIGTNKTEFNQSSENGKSGTISGAYASPDHPFVVSGSIYRSEDKYDTDASKNKNEFDMYSVFLGSYVGRNLLVGIDYGELNYKHTYQSKLSSFTDSTEYKQKDYGVLAKLLLEYANGKAFGLLARGEYRETGWDDRSTDYDKSFLIAPELFFNQTTSLKVNLGRSYFGDDDEVIGTNIELSFHKFIGQMFAIEAGVTKYDYEYSQPGATTSPDTGVMLSAEFWF